MDEALNGPMRVEIGYAPNSLGNVNAQTVPHSTFGGQTLLFNTRININPDLCSALNSGSKEPMEVVGMFLHEMLLARLYEHLYNNGYTSSSLLADNYSDIWNKFVQSKYPGIPLTQTQHQLMAQEYVSDIAFALWQLNGNLGTQDDYLIFAWQGLENAIDAGQKAMYGFIPNATELNALQNRYISNVRPLENNNKKSALTYPCR